MPRRTHPPRRRSATKASLAQRTSCSECDGKQKTSPHTGRPLPIKHAGWCSQGQR